MVYVRGHRLGVSPVLCLGMACVLGHNVARAWGGPWGCGVARYNVWHGVRLAFVSCGGMFGAERQVAEAGNHASL